MTFARTLALPAVAVLSLAAASTARAQTLGAVEQRIGRLEQSVRQLERRGGKAMAEPAVHAAALPPENVQASAVVALNERLGALERMVAGLIAGQEQDRRNLTVGLDQLQRLKGDSEARLEAMEQQVAALANAPKPEPVTTPAARTLTADDRFLEALDFASKGEWLKAEFAFDTFIANNPQHPRIIEARYWLGRSLLGEGKAAPAAQAFLELFEKHPDAPIALDNLFSLADALIALGPDSAAQACDVYGQIEGDFAAKLTAVQREQILDRRVKLNCK